MLKRHSLEAVIFDVDGTLIDTEQIQSDAFMQVLKNHDIHETELTRHGTVHVPGESTDETWARLKSRHDIPLELEQLTDHKRQAALDMLQGNLIAMPGAIELLNILRDRQVKLAVATSAQQQRLDHIIHGLGLAGYLDTMISANDVDNVKPAPDVYLAAARKLEVDPVNCIVIEDAEVGVVSAKAAGMKVIAVPNEFTHSMDFSNADLQVTSLEELDYEKLQNVLNS